MNKFLLNITLAAAITIAQPFAISGGTLAPGQRIDYSQSVQLDQRQLECLAQNIYHEARGQSEAGQVAVAHVTLNRAKAQNKSVCKVVYERGQFSWTGNGRGNVWIKETEKFIEIQKISIKTMKGKIPDNTNGALFFHASHVKPKWARKMEKTTKIDDHVFYKKKEDNKWLTQQM